MMRSSQSLTKQNQRASGLAVAAKSATGELTFPDHHKAPQTAPGFRFRKILDAVFYVGACGRVPSGTAHSLWWVTSTPVRSGTQLLTWPSVGHLKRHKEAMMAIETRTTSEPPALGPVELLLSERLSIDSKMLPNGTNWVVLALPYDDFTKVMDVLRADETAAHRAHLTQQQKETDQ